MAMTDHKITENMMENKRVTDAPDQPQGTAQQNKYLFDRLAKEVIIPAFNALIDSLTSAGGADIGVSVPGVSGTTVEAVLSSMKTLIDDRYTKSQSDANLKNKTDPLIKSVKLEPQTGIWTFTKENGQTVTVDTNLEKIALDVKLDSETKEFVLTLADGTEQRVSLSSFVRFLEFVGSDEIEFSTTGNTVKAGIKSGSIAEDKLNPALFSRLDTAVSTAESSAANAQTYAQKAQTQATNAAGSAVDAGIDAHNAETWTEGGQLMSEGGTLLPEHTTGAKEYAQMAQNSAGQAASSAANADTSKNAAAESAQRAEEAAKQAEEIAGGDFVTRSEFSSHTDNQEKHVTKEERTAWNAKLDEAKRGKAGGVASLDENGKVPAGELPEMNYDPAGSAQAVQQELNTHAANKTFHVTDVERQAWNNKAAGTHTHTAAQVGALPISGGTMTGALNMNGKALTNLPTPTNNKDAAPKDYVDATIAGKRGWTELERITNSKKWVVPDGVNRIGAFILGAGSSGSGDARDGKSAASGGPSGWGLSVILDVTPGESFDVVIGAGGASSHYAPSPGGDTKFGSYTALGGGKWSRGIKGGQDVSLWNDWIADKLDETNLLVPYGGVSALLPYYRSYSNDTFYSAWTSVLTPMEKNIFDPSMKVFGLGGCAYRSSSKDAKIFKPTDLGEMGKGGDAKVFSGTSYHATYYGGDATGYGNGGGACIVEDSSYAIGGKGSQGIVIIYV